MELADKLYKNHNLTDSELISVLQTDAYDQLLYEKANKMRLSVYGKDVYIRGLIEFSNYCKNDCLYCGIRKSNKSAVRYRLSKDEILNCCRTGYALGFRTFVLQSGEDFYFTDSILCDIVHSIKSAFPNCAVTLSAGERSFESYKALYDSGADRYLLRHETATAGHYKKLHPAQMSFENRQKCLFNLKEIGYQTGSGFMVSSPFQTTQNIVSDLRFLQKLNPDMIGIGPFIKHEKTPFKNHESGSLALTLRLISVLRLMFPYALIPATTALASIDKSGRLKALKAGANVVMPNLSPNNTRKFYDLYEHKLSSGLESADSIALLKSEIKNAGYEIVCDIGNAKKPKG